MGRLADLDAEMRELPDSEKEIQETKNMRAFVLGFELGQGAERDRIVKLLSRIADEYLEDKMLLASSIIHNAVASIKNSGE